MTEIAQPNNSRATDPRMGKTFQDKVKDLLRSDKLKVILKKVVPEGANALNARNIIAIKSTIDGKIKFKSRYVVGGHRDMLKHCLVYNAHTFQPTFARVMIALAATLSFNS